MFIHTIPPTHILHADDDDDDCFLFKRAVQKLNPLHTLTTVRNGHDLMQLLNDNHYQIHDVLFLDLNMPKKNGFECLAEIKTIKKLEQLPVVIFSTSYPSHGLEQLYANGAQYCIRKPNEFIDFTDKIALALSLIKRHKTVQPLFEKFVL